jgi:AcrR family transcriptional regulator
MTNKEQDAEERLKEAARKLFLEKGFAAVKTREIAEAANVNLALLNYYFRSKKKLYDIIMFETIHTFFSGMISVFNEETTSLKEKLGLFVEGYIDLLSESPDIVFFVMNEVKNHPEEFATKINLVEKVRQSTFIRQFLEAVDNKAIPNINPIHFMMNLASLVVFPFVSMPMIGVITQTKKNDILKVIQERKRLIPLWIEAMMTVK